jgi:hypothetical protein
VTHKDPVERVELSIDEIATLRRSLRLRFAGFMAVAVVLALISIYDHIMVKILMMFFLITLFWNFLKFHLRLKHDIEEGVKCVERITVRQDNTSGRRSYFGRRMVSSSYGNVELRVPKGMKPPEPGETVSVDYLPLSNHVLVWERVA